jgi:phage FluMu protein Com
MQIRCSYCGIPYSLSKEGVLAALDSLTAEDLKHFDIRCPKCRKVNHISREALLRAAPDWGKETDTAQNN